MQDPDRFLRRHNVHVNLVALLRKETPGYTERLFRHLEHIGFIVASRTTQSSNIKYDILPRSRANFIIQHVGASHAINFNVIAERDANITRDTKVFVPPSARTSEWNYKSAPEIKTRERRKARAFASALSCIFYARVVPRDNKSTRPEYSSVYLAGPGFRCRSCRRDGTSGFFLGLFLFFFILGNGAYSLDENRPFLSRDRC